MSTGLYMLVIQHESSLIDSVFDKCCFIDSRNFSKLGFFADIFNTYIYQESLWKAIIKSLVLRVNEPKRADVCTL